MCVNCVLASSRIAQVDLDDEPLPEVVLSHEGFRNKAFEDSFQNSLNYRASC
jgi:hypothetical protein